jgi:hypothetical protein
MVCDHHAIIVALPELSYNATAPANDLGQFAELGKALRGQIMDKKKSAPKKKAGPLSAEGSTAKDSSVKSGSVKDKSEINKPDAYSATAGIDAGKGAAAAAKTEPKNIPTRLSDLPELEQPQQLAPPTRPKNSARPVSISSTGSSQQSLSLTPTKSPPPIPGLPAAKPIPGLPATKAVEAFAEKQLGQPPKTNAPLDIAKSSKPSETPAPQSDNNDKATSNTKAGNTLPKQLKPAQPAPPKPVPTSAPLTPAAQMRSKQPAPPTPLAASSLSGSRPPASASITSGSQGSMLAASSQKRSSATPPQLRPSLPMSTNGNTVLAITEALQQQAEVTASQAQPVDEHNDASAEERRTARRRPAAPSRDRIAANDDSPSIGGLIYALNQKPSKKPFIYAAAGSGFWVVVTLAFTIAFLPGGLSLDNGIIGNPWFPTLIATVFGPIALFGFLALLAWRADELHLRSTAMTEVAVRLAEPDRMAEQSIASLGQAVRRQVSFMNDAVSRALGRAGELEALVHNEVSALEQSYEENERKIRGLISELANERSSLTNTGVHFQNSLQKMGVEIPKLMTQLSEQQLKLTSIIDGAGQNLTSLESALATQTSKFESTVGDRTTQLETVLTEYTEVLGTAIGSKTDNMQIMLGNYTEALGSALNERTTQLNTLLEDKRTAIEGNVGALTQTVEKQVGHLQKSIDDNAARINNTLTDRTETLQTVFEEYALALDATLANRAEALDSQLVERTKTLDEAFNDRLRLFDESVLRSTMAIDSAVGENTKTITGAMEVHARQLSDSIATQATELDETLMNGINSVRSTSENISSQSIKAIEGLASQSDMLRNVSENLLNQINSVTNRFENQGQAIMRSANALESTNFKIEQSLAGRTEDLNHTLDRMSGKAEELSRVVETYSTSLEGSLTGAEQRARSIAEQITKETEARSRSALDDLHRVKIAASRETDKALEELRREFSNVSQEVTQRLGSLTSQFSSATDAVREQAAVAARDLEQEQTRLKQQLDRLPSATEETASQMRRALSDQLRALDKLSSMASRSGLPDVTPATTGQPQPTRSPSPSVGRALTSHQPVRPGPAQEGPGLSSLTSSLQREITNRNAPNSAAIASASTPLVGSQENDAWSLGDLLARASDSNSDPADIPADTAPPPQADQPAPASGLDIAGLSRALDPTTAATVWSRFRAGQRGFMVRSIYAPESRNLFDGVARRYGADDNFKRLVDRFLNEFQTELSEADRQDPQGSRSQQLVQSETGRVYLVLAHASGRLV